MQAYINQKIEVIRKIWILSIIEETGSFRKTASLCKVTPSAVSQTLTSLEKNMGRALVFRGSKKTTLTLDGKRLIEEYAPVIQLLSSRYHCVPADKEVPEIKSLDFGTYESLAVRIVPALLSRLKTQIPNIKTSVHVSRSHELVKLIHERKLCTALIAEGSPLVRLHVDEITSDRLGVYIGKTSSPSWAIVEKNGLGTITAPNSYPVYYSRFCRSLPEHTINFRSDSFETLRTLALSGIVPCILPHAVAKRIDDGLVEIPLKKEITDKSKHKILLVSPKDCNPEETEFLKRELEHIFSDNTN